MIPAGLQSRSASFCVHGSVNIELSQAASDQVRILRTAHDKLAGSYVPPDTILGLTRSRGSDRDLVRLELDRRSCYCDGDG
jgi:hypothetical protein